MTTEKDKEDIVNILIAKGVTAEELYKIKEYFFKEIMQVYQSFGLDVEEDTHDN